MPNRIGRRGEQYCVIKIGTDESMGCHDTRTAAEDQRAAILANEEAEDPVAVLLLSLSREAREPVELASGEDIVGHDATRELPPGGREP